MMVAVLGPDGSGKSTVTSRVALAADRNFCCAEVYHFMPRQGHPCTPTMRVVDPHASLLRGQFESALKLVYYWLRFTWGYWVVVRRKSRGGRLILLDRYYHDMLADPRRYRMGAPASLVRLVGRFIPEPNLFLILDVEPDTVRARKTEVSEEESLRQFHAYRALADELPNAVLIDANQSPEEVVAACEKAIVEAMAGRVARRRSEA